MQSDYDDFEVPKVVMQTAIMPLKNASKNLEIPWEPVPQPRDPSPGHFIIMHFSEVQILLRNAVRLFTVSINGVTVSRPEVVRLPYLGTYVISTKNNPSLQEIGNLP
jgi:hypothetical protein